MEQTVEFSYPKEREKKKLFFFQYTSTETYANRILDRRADKRHTTVRNIRERKSIHEFVSRLEMERTNDDDEFLVLYRLYNTHISLAVSNSAPPENKVESEERKKN